MENNEENLIEENTDPDYNSKIIQDFTKNLINPSDIKQIKVNEGEIKGTIPYLEKKKIYEIKMDIIEIAQLIYLADTVEKREILLDRGMILSNHLNKLMKEYNLTVNDIKLMKSIYEEGFKQKNFVFDLKIDLLGSGLMTIFSSTNFKYKQILSGTFLVFSNSTFKDFDIFIKK